MSFKTKIINIFRLFFKIYFLEKLLRHLTKNKPTDNLICKIVPNNYQYSIGSIRRINYNGIILELDLHDYVGHYLYFGFMENGHDNLLSLVEENQIILDIGTNIGSTLLQFAKKLNNNGFVYGFEPDKFNYRKANLNISLNTFKNVLVENKGLGKVSGVFNLAIDCESNRGMNRIVNQENINTSKIVIVTLDEWYEKLQLEKIDLIKIDVEGYEMNVIIGGIKVLRRFKPILFIELDDNNLKLQDSSAKELITLLISLGYNITNAENKEIITEFSNFSNCHFDIVCK
jgi:FkbM family methyltransferase